MQHIYVIVTVFVSIGSCSFAPDTSDYDAYGIKVTANSVSIVEAHSNSAKFVVLFSPYNYYFDSLRCSVDFDDQAHYVYTVGVGSKQTSNSNPYFFFAGEVVPRGSSSTDASGNNGTFIGVWINRDPQNVQSYINNRQPLSCDYFQVERLHFMSAYDHQEFFVIAVDPYGQYALGFAEDFVFIYRPYPLKTVTSKPTNLIWPNNATFRPYAADADQSFTIVAGFVENSGRSRIQATPTVYLVSNQNLTVSSSWSYLATSGTWQSRLTFSNLNTWNKKYTMSISINPADSTRVLVGMPFLNTVFLFRVSNNGTNLTLLSSHDNGQSVGYGKGVTWLTYSQAAILVSTYSLDYTSSDSSKIQIYTSFTSTNFAPRVTAVFPNTQQPLPSTISAQFIQIVSTPSSLVILDINGGVLAILAESPGYYASTDTSNSPVAAEMPVVSHINQCIDGTFKVDQGIHPCVLCPAGSRCSSAANGNSTSCTSCSSNSYCPLGSVFEVDPSILQTRSQAYAYPRTPEMNVYEDILLSNMFSIGSSDRCVRISALFWTLIVLLIACVIILSVGVTHLFVHGPRADRTRDIIKKIFERTDLIVSTSLFVDLYSNYIEFSKGEGELWIGGLTSIAVIVMTIMAYVFGISYLNQYPAELVGASSFACDVDIRNAKYESNLKALAVPVSSAEKPIFDALNQQSFTLQLDVVNTVFSCAKLSVAQTLGSSTVQLQMSSCQQSNGILSARTILSEHSPTIVWTLQDIQLIGGIRIGLQAPGDTKTYLVLQDLDFSQTFYSESDRTLAQTVEVQMALTKVCH